jgi:hypothetical protein
MVEGMLARSSFRELRTSPESSTVVLVGASLRVKARI